MRRRVIPRHTIIPGRHKPVAHICHGTYILEGREPKRCLDYELWERWIDYDSQRCVVAFTQFFHREIIIETRFIGIDVAPTESLGPLLFETTVEGGELDGHQGLYRNWEEAQIGHDLVCYQVREWML